jgi:hypothetical protein
VGTGPPTVPLAAVPIAIAAGQSITFITVNGIVALVEGPQFVANHVPLQQGDNIIIARAVDTAGNTQEASMLLIADIKGDFIRIDATPESGIAPFDTDLTIGAPFTVSNFSFLATGPGSVTFVDNEDGAFHAQARAALTTTGLYYISVDVDDAGGTTHTDTVAVQVLDRQALDALLQAKWSAMKACLAAGDIEGALSYLAIGNRPVFEYNFNQLKDHLGEIVAGMQSVTLVKAMDNIAEYNLVGEQNGQSFSFYLLFEKDGHGIWRIKFF